MFNPEQIKHFLESLPFLQNVDVSSLVLEIRSLQVPAGCVLITQGDRDAQELFILFRGSVTVHRCDNLPPRPVPTLHHYKAGHITYAPELDIATGQQYGPEIAIISKPKSILGEQAIVNNKPRAVTVITNSDSVFFVLHRSCCEKFLKLHVKEELLRKQILNATFPSIFDSQKYSNIFKEKIYRLFRLRKYSRKHLISPTEKDYIYIVMNGEVALEYLKERHIFKQLCILSYGSLFGEELALGYARYKYRAVCNSSECTLLYFSTAEFLASVSPEHLSVLQHHFNLKLELEQRHVLPPEKPPDDDQIPCYQLKQLVRSIQRKKKLHNKIESEHRRKRDADSLTSCNWFQPHSLTRRHMLEYSDKPPVLLALHQKNRRFHSQSEYRPNTESQRQRPQLLEVTRRPLIKRTVTFSNSSAEYPSELEFMFATNLSGFMPSNVFSKGSSKHHKS